MEVVTEIPAGKHDSADEDPLACGKREFKEKTGAEAEKFIPLGRLYPSPGYCGEVIWMFAAIGLKYGEQHPDDDEFLSVEKIPLEKGCGNDTFRRDYRRENAGGGFKAKAFKR